MVKMEMMMTRKGMMMEMMEMIMTRIARRRALSMIASRIVPKI